MNARTHHGAPGFIDQRNAKRIAAWKQRMSATAGRDLADLRNDQQRALYRDVHFRIAIARRDIYRQQRIRRWLENFIERAAFQSALKYLRQAT